MELCDDGVNYAYMTSWESSSVQPENLFIDQICWRYRGEGNANIVIALEDEVTIIRLSKTNVNGVSWWDKQKKKVERQVIFATHVFAPLLGSDFVAKVHAVYIPQNQIVQLNECLQRLKLRPGHRLHKELKVPSIATAHSDFARSDSENPISCSYCVEIKPKKGWWVKSKKEMGDLRPDLCTYCLNQYHKLKKGKIISRSNYCPLDLFSGKPALMVQAVISLLSNPQNNLRIFRDGNLVYGDATASKDIKNPMSSSLDSLIHEWIASSNIQLNAFNSRIRGLNSLVYLICLALLKPQAGSNKKGKERYFQLKEELQQLLLNYSITEKNYGQLVLNNDKTCKDLSRKTCCTQETSELPDGSVLSKILSAQKLEESDTSHIKKIYKKICPIHGEETRLHLLTKTFTVNCLTFEDCPSNKCISGEMWLDEIQTSHLNPLELLCLQRNLLAATVKDCSIMMTLSPVSSLSLNWPSDEINASLLQDLHKGFHHSRVGIVDLDPKCISAVVKHSLREPEMLKAYYSTPCE